MNKIYASFRHNSGVIVCLFLGCFVLFSAYSCQSTVVSIVNPQLRITRSEMVAEVNSFLAIAESRFEDLDRQDLVKGTLFNHAVDLLQGGRINPAGIALLLGNVLGIGAVIDNVRKRTHINTLKGEYLNGKVETKLKEILQPTNDGKVG